MTEATVAVQQLSRVFRFGATELPDTDPSLPPEQVLKHYAGAYPFLAVAELGTPEVEEGRMVYPVVKREAQTKGNELRRLTPAQSRVLAQLDSLDQAESESAPNNARRWFALSQFTTGLLKRAPTPVADAMMVPML